MEGERYNLKQIQDLFIPSTKMINSKNFMVRSSQQLFTNAREERRMIIIMGAANFTNEEKEKYQEATQQEAKKKKITRKLRPI